MSSTCNTCHATIRWDKERRVQMNWKGPLNPDLSKHMCRTANQNVEEKKEQSNTPLIEESVLIVAISQLKDAINNLALAQLASTEEERNKIKERITV